MTTSGTYAFFPTFAELLDEAFERCGRAPDSLEHEHIVSAFRSLNLLQVDIENRIGEAQFRLDRIEQPLTLNQRGFALPDGTLDVTNAYLLRVMQGVRRQIPLMRITKYQWDEISPQNQSGLPSQFFVTKELPQDLSYVDETKTAIAAGAWGPDVQIDGQPTDRLNLVFWSATDQTEDILLYYRLRFHQDALALDQHGDYRRVWFDTIAAGWAWQLSKKYARELTTDLRNEYLESFAMAKMESRDRGPTLMYGRGIGRSYRRRRI